MSTNQPWTVKPWLGAITLVLATAAVAVTPAAQAFGGEPIVVDNAGDDAGAGGLTLRAALAQAESTPDDDLIVFAPHILEIHLTQGELWIGNMVWPPTSGELTIDGEGRVTIDAGGQSGILDIQSGTVNVKGLRLVSGYASLGGAVMVWDRAIVTLENSVVEGNYATTAGGGICSIGILTMRKTYVVNNYSRDTGGGLYIDSSWGGQLDVFDSTFSGNEARSAGGGIFNYSAIVTLTATVITDNVAANGGGIYNYHGYLTINLGVFSDNRISRKGKGGDIYYTYGSFDPTGYEDLDLFVEMPKRR